MSTIALDDAVRTHLNRGWKIADRTETSVTLTRKKKFNLFLHIVMTLITGGIWLLVILLLLLNRGQEAVTLTVDDSGRVVKS